MSTTDQSVMSLREFFPLLEKHKDALSQFKTSENAFTRDRLLELVDVVGAVLLFAAKRNMDGYEITLQEYFDQLTGDQRRRKVPSRSAFCMRREQVSWKAFEYLLEQLQGEHRRSRGAKLWRGHRAIAVDGARVTIPDCRGIDRDEFFSTPEAAKSGELPYALVVCAMELGSGVFAAASAGGCRESERKHFADFLKKFEAGDLFVLDRGFTGMNSMSAVQEAGMFFVMRVTAGKEEQAAPEVAEFIQEYARSGRRDQLIDLPLSFDEAMTVRLVMYKPKRAKKPILVVTNLLDSRKYPAQAIAELYGARWQIETAFNQLKNVTRIESLRARTGNGILQEIYAHLWVSTAVAIIATRIKSKKKPQITVPIAKPRWRSLRNSFAH